MAIAVRAPWAFGPSAARKGCGATRLDTQQKTAGRPRAAGGVGPGLAGTLEEALELSAPDRVLQLADRLGLDLADPLAGDLEDPADLLEGVGVAVAQAVAELDDLALAVGQGLQHLVDLLLEHLLGRRVD